MSFETLKRNRGSNINKIIQAAEATSSGEQKSYVDERIWKPTVDKAGNGYAVIRFLPGKDGEIPFVRYWDHGFKGPTGLWYIENSLTSIGQPDPVGELNSRLWNSGIESDKEKARSQKRRLHYVTNIMVVSDPSAPQNEGKVFLYKYGKKIFDKIYDLMNPSFADETPVDPFDFWEGADFKLKIRKVDGYWNYDKSEFAAPKPLLNDDAKLESIWKQAYSLADFEAPKNFKTYEKLKDRLDLVLGLHAAPTPTPADESLEDLSEGKTPSWGAEVSNFREKAVASSPVEDEEDALSYFSKLAEEE